jgi:hypothetical protein
MGVQHGNLEKELSDELLDSKNSIFSHINWLNNLFKYNIIFSVIQTNKKNNELVFFSLDKILKEFIF